MRRISLFALLFAVHLGAAGEARMHLASQYRWERKDGFYLSFENSAKEKIPPLSSLRLITGIGDGQSWQFISRAAPWELGHEYLVEVSIGAQATETKIDGQLLGRLERRCVPVAAPVELNTVPSWAAGLTS